MPSAATAPRHVPGVLGLRGLAAAAIVVYHVWLYGSPSGPVALPEPFATVVTYGRAGTGLFMVLTSFLLYLPFVRAVMTDEPQPSARRFLTGRILRLVPAYWLILLVVALPLGAALIRSDGTLIQGSLADRPDLLVANLLLVQNFRPETFLTGIGPAWFVSAVAVFYLVLPLLGRLGAALGRGSAAPGSRALAALVPAVALIALGLTVKVAVLTFMVPPGWTPGWDADWPSVIVRSFLGQADRLGYGMAVAVAWSITELRAVRLPAGWWAIPLGAALVTGAGGIWLQEHDAINRLALESVLTLSAALIVLPVAMPNLLPPVGRAAVRVLGGRVLAAVGVVSYSIYLWNEPIIRWMAARGLTLPGAGALPVNLAMVAAAVGVLSAATYLVAERPVLKRRRAAAAPASLCERPT